MLYGAQFINSTNRHLKRPTPSHKVGSYHFIILQLKLLDLPSLHYQCRRGDIKSSSIMINFFLCYPYLQQGIIISRYLNPRTCYSRLFFLERVTNDCNSLPFNVSNAPSVNSFKELLTISGFLNIMSFINN